MARDGLEIEAYLTLPNNFEGKPIPAIVRPHGGPMVREYGMAMQDDLTDGTRWLVADAAFSQSQQVPASLACE